VSENEAREIIATIRGEVEQAADLILSAMQAATSTSVSAIQGIAETIGKVSSIATAIASAVEEQSAATGEIASNVTEAASSTRDVSTNIKGLSDGVATDQRRIGAAAHRRR
jgi:methyl-accepting chemotaxis protein